jgi:hypothetical protein
MYVSILATSCTKWTTEEGHSEITFKGRALAQAVTLWLPTLAARVPVRAKHVEFVVDKAALGQVFSKYFGFPCYHHSTNFSIIIITRGWHNMPIGGRSA